MPINNQIILRRGTATQWSTTNPVLASGEPGYDITNRILKIGDGTTSWNSLSNHQHTSSEITNFNSSVSGLLPVTNIVAGTNITVSNNAGAFTINSTAAGGGGGGGGATISNSGVNRLLVSDGSTSGIVGQANLTFNGSLLNVTGSGSFSSNLTLSNQTASTIASFDANKNVISLDIATYPSLTELSYVKGVTSALQTQLGNKSDISHIHGNMTGSGTIGSVSGRPVITTTNGALTTTVFGSTASTFCEGNDIRLSDSRTPTSHTHGNITNAGAIGSTANLPLITTTAGAITVGSFGSTANTFCQGNDSRLSDSRTPLSHTHTAADITNLPVTNIVGSTGITVSSSNGVFTIFNTGSGVSNNIGSGLSVATYIMTHIFS